MIDLHLHTTYSDGSDEPEKLLSKAQEAGLDYISITDHDSIGAYEKLSKLKISDYFNSKIIPGCEFTAAHNGTPIEILGYGIDLETIRETGIVSEEKFFERENTNLKKMMEVCKNLGIKYDETLSITGEKYFATQVLYFNFKKYPENEKHFSPEVWGGLNAFYRTCVNNEENPFFLNQLAGFPSLSEVTKIIHKAGGLAFLAHLYGYYADDHVEYLNSMVSLNELDGIECYHSLHSIERTDFLIDYCRKHNLYVSGGSDYHGKIKPAVKISETVHGMRIPYSAAKPWLHKCITFS